MTFISMYKVINYSINPFLREETKTIRIEKERAQMPQYSRKDEEEVLLDKTAFFTECEITRSNKEGLRKAETQLSSFKSQQRPNPTNREFLELATSGARKEFLFQ